MSQPNLNLSTKATGPVECLGQSFASEEVRREHYLKLLAQKLKDPEFRKIEGFPIGTDEDILALSDPPYYTACPNPWLGEFIKGYGTPYDPKQPYHREPFAADVSEGKNHPIYNAHSYHTKVPHRAIMRYILHYTQPGDVVFDGFCGTGMTGVAAQLCGDRSEIQELGYRVQSDGTILNEEGKTFSRIGARRAILNDLSPAATFIASNYNTPVDADIFESEAKRILKEVEEELGWMYATKHTDGKTLGRINFTVWSDVFSCPECGKEVVFWDAAVDVDQGGVRDEFGCPNCAAQITKRACERAWNTTFDRSLNATVKQAKQVPVVINYSVGGKRYEKRPDAEDIALSRKVEQSSFGDWFPTDRMMDGGETRRNDDDGITHVHHFYSARNRAVLAAFWRRINDSIKKCATLGLWFTSSHVWATRQNRLLVSNYFKKKGGVIGQTLQGTLYISSVGVETNAIERFGLRIDSVPFTASARCAITGTGSTATISTADSSVDYLFVDPPFGANIAYSELNFLWESWLRVVTNYEAEAIENRPHRKALSDYHDLMRKCFKECYRILKPGRWITIEFSNTQAAVWNSIQSSLGEVGFVIANVSVLEKEHKGYRAVTTPTAVKQDLVISAYKPNGGLEERFTRRGATAEGAWDFVQTHLRNLPVVKAHGGQLDFIAERDPRTLYDRMVAFYVGHSTPVPMNSAEFQAGLAESFPERDGMFFLPEQVNEYDKKRAQVENIGQLSIFVEDERSAINWLRSFLKSRPSTSQDIRPEFMQQLGASWKKWEARPEMSALLDQNFLCYDGVGEVPSQIHSYLSTQFKELRNLSKDHAQLKAKAKNRWFVPDPKKNVDVETLRNKRLLEEFWSYLPDGYTPPALSSDKGQALPGLVVPRPKVPKGKKLKELRTEAVRVGFKHCYQQKDYTTILVVADMLPESVLNEDEQLQMIYDTAVTRSGEEG
jgi:DNA modification methylase